MINVSCAKCGKKILFYQKDGQVGLSAAISIEYLGLINGNSFSTIKKLPMILQTLSVIVVTLSAPL